ncbi:hypothetical protein DTW90_19735 [Neorhizobium sp. P12A]|uniref:hypothetical protein n=1 Tax=Neorhizobium sp. P12A TaxID=2268027 RepID=UPI0011ED3CFC|nr:hypothetical protein [Neorhizobium sp. P12A]KAA0697615.1 hypothetical protein DTW90_19735 [Neorhizobium sp. P12A]
MVSSRHHHHISPFTVVVLLLLAGIVAGVQTGYFKNAFHKDILARVNPADVLTPADLTPANLAPVHVAAGQVAAPAAQSSVNAAH